jgi:hypothetical protein
MIIFCSALLIALVGTSFYLTSKMKSGGFQIATRIRSVSALDRLSVGFFLTALILVAVDQLYWAWYWQTPNYLSVLAALAALGGLVYTIARAPSSTHSDSADDKRAELLSVFAVFVAFLAFYSVTGWIDRSPYNAHVRQALAFLQGRVDIGKSPGIEQISVAGRYYQLHPPLPAFLLMPFVAIWGMDTNQTAFSLVTGAIDAALAWWLLGRLRLSVSARTWLTIFFGAGTVIWFETLNGGSWDISQTVAVGFTLAALGEVFGEARPWLVGLLSGLSALARNDLALDFPIFIGLCYVRRRNLRELLGLFPGFALAGVTYIALNEVRFRSIFDLGQFIYSEGKPTFAWAFLPQNLYTLLFMPPKLDTRFPFIHPISSGQALTFTSPAFVLSLRASLASFTPLLLMAGAVLAVLPSLFFNNNGGAQFGTRHYIHSFPFLLVLMAQGLPGEPAYVDQITKVLIVASILLIGLGVFHLRLYGFG